MLTVLKFLNVSVLHHKEARIRKRSNHITLIVDGEKQRLQKHRQQKQPKQ